MPRARRPSSSVVLFPPEKDLRASRKRLPIYKPHNLRAILKEAKKAGGDEDRAFVEVFRKRNREQAEGLLRMLGIDPSTPGAWERGFFKIAFLHHGVGHLAYVQPRTNANSATWTLAADFRLLGEVSTLCAKGLSERAAVRKLAADPKKRTLFPYRPQLNRHYSDRKELAKREDALWARLQSLKARCSLDRALPSPEPNGVFEDILMHVDIGLLLSSGLVKIKSPSE
jgi:hypothetical protein